MKKCPACHAANTDAATECEKCAVIFAHLKNHELSANKIYRASCGWPNCTTLASPRIKTPRGFLNLCLTHYDEYWHSTPRNAGDPNGWADQQQMKKTYVSYRERWYAQQQKPYQLAPIKSSEHLKHWTALHGKQPREPGSDDE